MSKRVSSSDWTGPTGKEVQRGAFTHRIGDFGGTTEYKWAKRKLPIYFGIPEELWGIAKLAGWLIISPLLLVVAWIVGDVGAPGAVVSDPSALLLFWGIFVPVIGTWQLVNGSLKWINLRTFMLSFLIIATAAISLGYGYVAQDAISSASVGKAERVIPYVAGTKRTMSRRNAPIFRHQRADGSDLEGDSRRPPLEYGNCITAQLISGHSGFRWVRVVEQRPPLKPGQIGFPVRRAECFSDMPLASLPR